MGRTQIGKSNNKRGIVRALEDMSQDIAKLREEEIERRYIHGRNNKTRYEWDDWDLRGDIWGK